MTCCCTADPARATLGAPDPGKHVNYVLGMVLGVDDLDQDFAYLDNRVQAVARELVGYGTDRGLAVHVEPTERGPQVRVTAGVAYSPSGEMICVGSDQCAVLNNWLRTNASNVADRLGTANQATLRLYVTLCYRSCLTDKVPIPGEPCRTEDALMSPSRVTDAFSLELRFTPPLQTEEDAVREFVRWLHLVPVVDHSLPDKADDLLGAIRAAASPWLLASPPDPWCGSPPDSPLGSPPDSPLGSLTDSPPGFMLADPPTWLVIPRQYCAEYLRAAFRLWVTELRPVWIARFGGCHAGCAKPAIGDDCVLLAALDVPILLQSPGLWEVSDVDAVHDDQSCRPYLLHARMQQEWLLAMCACCDAQPPLPDLGGDLSGPIDDGTVRKIQGIDVIATGASEKQVLTFAGGSWHPADLPPEPAKTLGGDVQGPLDATRLMAIHTVPVADTPPALNQFLGFDGTNWTPRPIVVPPVAVPALAGDAIGPIGSNLVTGLQAFKVAKPNTADTGAALVFTGADWQLGRFAATGNYVRFPDKETGYAIVAAGRFGFEIDNEVVVVAPFEFAADVAPSRPFANLRSIRVQQSPKLPYVMTFTFDEYADRLAKGILMVKATPGWLPIEPTLPRKFPTPGQRTVKPYQIFFAQFTKPGFQLLITGFGLESLADVHAGEIEIEVGWYPGE
jgi:hypothetical protein